MPAADPELQRMQQEAVRRVREMQARAQLHAGPPVRQQAAEAPRAAERAGSPAPGGTNRREVQTPVAASVPQARREPRAAADREPQARQAAQSPKPQPQQPTPQMAVRPPGAGILDFLTKDSERTLLLVLLLLLKEEGADLSLLFALMYLIL